MKATHISVKACACFLLMMLLWIGPAAATDNYAYRAGEYAIISGGRSPDGRWSVAAHGDDSGGYDGFQLYLMREPAHEKLVPLRTGDHLDTAPLSNIALWAPDSRSVVILYRTDRHVLEMRLFAVVDGKTRAIKAPSLVDTIGRGHFKPGVQHELLSRYYHVTWPKSDRFTLEEFDTFTAVEPIFNVGLEPYLKVDQESADRTITDFSASAVCEITAGGKLRLSGMKPLLDQERTIVYSPHLRVEPGRGLYDTETTLSSLESQKGRQ